MTEERYVHPGIKALHPYEAGATLEAALAHHPKSPILKLASNENPLGPSPLVLEMLKGILSKSHLYPYSDDIPLRETLGKRLDLDCDWIVVGNGSDEILARVARTCLKPGHDVVITQYAFATFAIIAHMYHGRPVIAPSPNFEDSTDAILSAITPKTDIIFIANPNNPTGTWIPKKSLIHLLEKVPSHVMVVLDEAYCEYMNAPDYPNSLTLLPRFSNLVITRTFSKIYGLAGLRLGYGIAHPEWIHYFNLARLPFNVNRMAQAAGKAALEDEAHLETSRQMNQLGLAFYQQHIPSLGIQLCSKGGNFITIDLKQPALPIYESLLKQGIITRPLMPYQLPNHLRITVSDAKANERVIDTLSKLL